MKDRLEQRLKELKLEFEQGQKMLADLEKRQADLRNTVLRISGAIQVLEEVLGQTGGAVESVAAAASGEVLQNNIAGR